MLKTFRGLSAIHNVPFSKRFMCVKRRKFPINPEEAKDLPIFDYGVSKKTYNRVFVCGNIQTGALGVAYLKSKDNPEKKEYLKSPRRLSFAEKFEVTTAACGFGFTVYAVNSDTDVKLYGTGLNTDSQIGYHAVREGNPLELIYFPQPISLPFRKPKKSAIRKLAAGRAHLVVLSDEGLFLLGNNSYGQCSREIIPEENYFHSNFINHIPEIDGQEIVDIECGQDHTFALSKSGAVFSCGWGADGQTGLGHFANSPHFAPLQGDIAHEQIVKVSSRSDFALALNAQGQVFGWGNAEYDQIATSNNEQQVCTPIHLAHLDKLGPIVDVAAGGSFCTVVNAGGEVFVWGYGILGAGPRVERSAEPVRLPETLFGRNDFQPDNKVVGVTCGLSYSVAVTNLGDAFTWGRNTRSCLGLGDLKDQFFPLKVALGGRASSVFCGVDHTVYILSLII